MNLKKENNVRFQVGDTVRIAKTSKFYDYIGLDFPKDTNGEVIYLSSARPNIKVGWDSGGWEWFRESDLRLVKR